MFVHAVGLYFTAPERGKERSKQGRVLLFHRDDPGQEKDCECDKVSKEAPRIRELSLYQDYWNASTVQ